MAYDEYLNEQPIVGKGPSFREGLAELGKGAVRGFLNTPRDLADLAAWLTPEVRYKDELVFGPQNVETAAASTLPRAGEDYAPFLKKSDREDLGLLGSIGEIGAPDPYDVVRLAGLAGSAALLSKADLGQHWNLRKFLAGDKKAKIKPIETKLVKSGRFKGGYSDDYFAYSPEDPSLIPLKVSVKYDPRKKDIYVNSIIPELKADQYRDYQDWVRTQPEDDAGMYDYMAAKYKHSIGGPRLQDILGQLKHAYPDAETISGFRITGTRRKSSRRSGNTAIKIPYSKEEADLWMKLSKEAGADVYDPLEEGTFDSMRGVLNVRKTNEPLPMPEAPTYPGNTISSQFETAPIVEDWPSSPPMEGSPGMQAVDEILSMDQYNSRDFGGRRVRNEQGDVVRPPSTNPAHLSRSTQQRTPPPQAPVQAPVDTGYRAGIIDDIDDPLERYVPGRYESMGMSTASLRGYLEATDRAINRVNDRIRRLNPEEFETGYVARQRRRRSELRAERAVYANMIERLNNGTATNLERYIDLNTIREYLRRDLRDINPEEREYAALINSLRWAEEDL